MTRQADRTPIHRELALTGGRARAFGLLSNLYRQMYANTGIATDSARVSRASRWARLIARPCRRLLVARPLPASGNVSALRVTAVIKIASRYKNKCKVG